MEPYRDGKYLHYIGRQPRIPVLRIKVTEPIRDDTLALAAPVDTGFAGYLLLGRSAYERLATAEVPREHFGIYQTMAGPVVLRRSRVLLALGERQFESYIETPVYGVGRLLLGRSVLSKLNLAILGTRNRCCYLETDEQQ